MRIMGLDYGSATVGVAISDELHLTAQGLEVIRRRQENKLRQTLARIKDLVEEYSIELIVVGLPKHMNNTIGERAEKSKEFADMLEKKMNIPVVLWDERLTTIAAHRVLSEGRVKPSGRSEVVDQIAASFILQGYLDLQKNREACKEIENERNI